MSTNDAQQLAFDGMAPRKRRKRAPAEKIVAAEDPIAQVVLDVQATHLGQTFDYLVEERWSQTARPGVMVRVRFGGRLLNGEILALSYPGQDHHGGTVLPHRGSDHPRGVTSPRTRSRTRIHHQGGERAALQG